MSDISLNAESASGPSLSYWQLVRRRFVTNKYGMAGLIGCTIIIVSAIFAGFFAPYSVTNKDGAAIYSPPQGIHFIAPEGGLTHPYIMSFAEEMDPNTFEIKFVPDPNTSSNLGLFVKGDPWTFLGMNFETHFLGTTDGKYVHFLGTDSLGRDVFSRMIFGTRVTLLMAVIVVAASGLIGTIIGVSSGYFGGTYDTIVQRFVEFIKAFPDLPLILVLVALLPKRTEPMTIFLLFALVLILLGWADLSRELRGKAISIRSMDYVRSAVAVGASDTRVIRRHVIPNLTPHLIVWASFTLPSVILAESFLSFIGVGVQPPMVSWGSMLNQVRDFQSFASAPWLMSPVIMIVLSVLSFNAFGDGLRDAMDPYST